MTKHTVTSIKIERVEGYNKDCFTVLANTLEQAEQAIKLMSLSAPGAGEGYDKTDFTIKWDDGSTYQGRIDLQADMATKEDNLTDHIKASLSYRIDQLNIPQDMRITQKDYDEFVENYLTA